jgi:hypothetical protein
MYLRSPKATGQRSKRKRGGPDIITDIPLYKGEVVNEITVTRQKKRIVTSSKRVHIRPAPIQPAPTTQPPTDIPPHDSDIYSDAEDTNIPLGTNGCERKGPSHSVSVRVSSVPVYLSQPLTSV